MATLRQFLGAWSIRHSFGSNDNKRDAGQTTPEDIIRFDNILFGNDKRLKKWQLLDVYRPKAQGNGQTEPLKKLPVIISVHGGAWVYGDKDRYQFYCMRLAQYGFAVINFSYRLAPEAKFPAAIEDIEKAFEWMLANADQYGFDTTNVFAAGDSAGAHLLTLYVAALTNPECAKNFPFIKPLSQKNMTLRALALNCGKYSIEPTDSQLKLLLNGMMPNGGTPQEIALLNAASQITKDFPQSFVMTCYGDFLFEQAPVVMKALEAAGVKCEYHCYASPEKPLVHVFHLDPKLEEAKRCNTDECNFFKRLVVTN